MLIFLAVRNGNGNRNGPKKRKVHHQKQLFKTVIRCFRLDFPFKKKQMMDSTEKREKRRVQHHCRSSAFLHTSSYQSFSPDSRFLRPDFRSYSLFWRVFDYFFPDLEIIKVHVFHHLLRVQTQRGKTLLSSPAAARKTSCRIKSAGHGGRVRITGLSWHIWRVVNWWIWRKSRHVVRMRTTGLNQKISLL